MKRGHAKTATHDYRRHGTTTLFAAIELLSGNVVSQCMPRHRHQEWLKLETRGWDHGLWVPLRILVPEANIPIVEIAQPNPTTPAELLRIGQALAPLRDRGVVIAGSGGIVHNLRAIHLGDKTASVDDWAKQFDDWFATHLAAGDFETLTRYRDLAPHAALAVPTPEHFDPVFVALGASRDTGNLTTIYEGFHYGSLSMRAFAFA